MLGLQIRLSSAYTSVDDHVRGFQGANPEQRECAAQHAELVRSTAQQHGTAEQTEPPSSHHHQISKNTSLLRREAEFRSAC